MAGFRKGSIDFRKKNSDLISSDVYQDHLNLYGIDDRLKYIDENGVIRTIAISGDITETDLSNYLTISEIASISGNLQSQIDNIDVSGDIISYVNPISASLQSQIWSNDIDIAVLRSNVNTISGDLDALELTVANLDLTYATDASLAAISGNLQSQIDGIPTYDLSPYTLTSTTASISGNLYNYSSEIDEDQLLSLIHNCPVTSFVDSISGMDVVYTDFRTIINHEKHISKDIDGLPEQSIETFDYNGYSYTITKDLVFTGGNFQSSTININKV